MSTDRFELVSPFQPTGDQPEAIDALVKSIEAGNRMQTLKGVTGSGKTFTMANIIQRINRPTLVLAHNKTLAAQLCSEFKEFFPKNAVEYFVSYYDYYQPEAYIASTDTYIEKDSALERRFQSVLVEEPTGEETMAILRGLRPRYEQHHEMLITDDALEAAVRLSVRYFPGRFLPDKAIDLLDEAAARLRIYRAGRLPGGGRGDRRISLTGREVQQAAGAITGLSAAPGLTAERLESSLRQSVVGQQEAVETVIRAILRSSAGLRDPRRPIGSFLFLGPSGVGKTQLCHALGRTLFGSEDSIIKLDMSEYREPHSISRLIGSPPGYVGCEDGGILTEAVKKHPMSVVVFDEIEKAHPDLYNLLLQIMEDGRLTDSQGRVAVFSNTVVILTSNLGAEAMLHPQGMGFTGGAADAGAAVLSRLREHLRPELLGRLDETILFRPLQREELRQITGMLLEQVQGRLREASDGRRRSRSNSRIRSPRRSCRGRRQAPTGRGRCGGWCAPWWRTR